MTASIVTLPVRPAPPPVVAVEDVMPIKLIQTGKFDVWRYPDGDVVLLRDGYAGGPCETMLIPAGDLGDVLLALTVASGRAP
jgi:hypothetical protein